MAERVQMEIGSGLLFIIIIGILGWVLKELKSSQLKILWLNQKLLRLQRELQEKNNQTVVQNKAKAIQNT